MLPIVISDDPLFNNANELHVWYKDIDNYFNSVVVQIASEKRCLGHFQGLFASKSMEILVFITYLLQSPLDIAILA